MREKPDPNNNTGCLSYELFKFLSRYANFMSKFVYVVTAAEGIILSSLFIGRKQR